MEPGVYLMCSQKPDTAHVQNQPIPFHILKN